ncbi:hypothetical protein OS493_028292 [Desmophyllum pertusum]|uniref:Peptidase S1 domain-containing protein n=1 Tax=Desmophyllum pertusum TaxID=174260 RepID=A0A9W9YKK1_9CNID|nr:hypothetical protein OS493_028292 [Desmophyllum pertusum]
MWIQTQYTNCWWYRGPQRSMAVASSSQDKFWFYVLWRNFSSSTMGCHCSALRPGKSPSSIRVRLGAHYRSANEGTAQDFEIERIISHHSYKRPYGMAHDIAMLKLRRPAQINKAVNLACLPGSSGRVSRWKNMLGYRLRNTLFWRFAS